jgi:hypothetical protein
VTSRGKDGCSHQQAVESLSLFPISVKRWQTC